MNTFHFYSGKDNARNRKIARNAETYTKCVGWLKINVVLICSHYFTFPVLSTNLVYFYLLMYAFATVLEQERKL